MAEEQLSCLLCCARFWEEEDVKTEEEVISDYQREKGLEFNEGLGVFWKLVGGVGRIGKQVGKRMPCCAECGEALKGILELQRALEEMKASLEEQVETLKRTVLGAQDTGYQMTGDNEWATVRLQLVKCILGKSAKMPGSHVSKRTPNILKRKRNLAQGTLERKVENPILEQGARVEYILPNDTWVIPESQDNLPDPLDLGDTFEEAASFSLPSPPPPKKAKRTQKKPAIYEITTRPCSVRVERLSPSDIENFAGCSSSTGKRRSKLKARAFLKKTLAGAHNQSDPESEEDQEDDFRPSKKPKVPSIIKTPKRSYSKINTHFINEKLILYKYTVLQVSHGGTQFQCLEPGCSEVLSDPSWYSLFSKMHQHVESLHLDNKEVTLVRECPLCYKKLKGNGPHFRLHLLKDHNRGLVVCESCWKPINNKGSNYRDHIWKHKNAQEQRQQCEHRPPSKFVRKLMQAEEKNQFPDQVKQLSLNITISPPDLSPRLPFSHVIKPNLILYKYTLLQVSRNGTQFSCLEYGCNTKIQDRDWYCLFKKVYQHVETDHLDTKDSKMYRQCPVCQEGLTRTGNQLRTHLLQGHSLDHVVCESCWMPIKNAGENYRCHVWKHKNWQEKLQLQDGPHRAPSKFLKKLKSLNLAKTVEKSETKKPEIKKAPAPPKPRKESEKDNPVASSFPLVITTPERTILQAFTHLITPDLVLYKFTLLQVSLNGTQFTCLESGCSEVLCDLDWYALFEKMHQHVENCHLDARRIMSPNRECPVCHQHLNLTGAQFRSHLLLEHKRDQVVCESCWRPIKNSGDNYRCHTWKHKSLPEQQTTLHRPPTKLLRALKLKGAIIKEGSIQGINPAQRRRLKMLRDNLARKPLMAKDFTQFEYRSADAIYKLSENLRLYQSTVFSVDPGKGISCLEVQCSTSPLIVPGAWNSSALTAFQAHVHASHQYIELVHRDNYGHHRCPICQQDLLMTPKQFTGHLLRRCGTMEITEARVPIICPVCEKPGSSADKMRFHLWTHKSPEEQAQYPGGVKPSKTNQRGTFVCQQCGKVFKYYSCLRAHELTHVPKERRRKQHICEMCGMHLCGPAGLRNHIERKHRPDLLQFRDCPVCNQRFNRRDFTKFKDHLRCHNEPEPFKCEVCGKGFNSSVSLKTHRERVHCEERKYQCGYCEMSYKEAKNLRRHVRKQHPEEK